MFINIYLNIKITSNYIKKLLVRPVGPVAPVLAALPGDPMGPVGPVAPVSMAKPGGPSWPVGPVGPVDEAAV